MIKHFNLFIDSKAYESVKRNFDDYKEFQLNISDNPNSKTYKSKLRNFPRFDEEDLRVFKKAKKNNN